MPHNIERSVLRPGEYIGYSAIGAWRIKRYGSRSWVMQPGIGIRSLPAHVRTQYIAGTLDQLSRVLEGIKP